MADEPWEFELLRLFAHADAREDLHWHVTPDGSLRFAVDCSDTFGWGCADSQDVREDDLPELRRAYKDARGTDGGWLWPTLWCARKREERPMHAVYVKRLSCVPSGGPEGTMAALFDLAGPARERTMWAP